MAEYKEAFQQKRIRNCTCSTPLECAEFMERYIEIIFNPNATVSPIGETKEKFNKLAQQCCGRREFNRFVTAKRVNNMNVCETVYLQLLANFATILHLCNEDDDIDSAKILMILSFTFHTNGKYLYEDLRSHEIWKSMRFWNAAFLHAVHTERKLRIPSDKNFSEQTMEQRQEHEEVHKNIFFGQLTSFLTNMKALELPSSMINEFRERTLVFQDLDEEQCRILADLTTGKDSSYTYPKTADLSPKSLDVIKSFGKSVVHSISKTFS